MYYMDRPYAKKLQKSIDDRLTYINALLDQLMQEEEIAQADLKEGRATDDHFTHINALRKRLTQEEEAVNADIKVFRTYKIKNERIYLNTLIKNNMLNIKGELCPIQLSQ